MTRTCSFEGCDRPHYGRGWCGMHYKRVWRSGSAELPEKEIQECSVDGCTRPVRSLGYCNMHHQRWLKHGTPLSLKPTPERRFWSKVRKTPGCWEWSGALDGGGYGLFTFEGRQQGAHRVSLSLCGLVVPEGCQVDHRCHNRRCVNPSHLRVVTAKQNAEHRTGPDPRNRSSGVRGVYRRGKRWSASIYHYGEHIYFGTFDTVEEAAQVVKVQRKKYFTHDDYDEWVNEQRKEDTDA